MALSLKRRVEALEAALGGKEVTLEEIVLWSMRQGPYDAETQERYEEYLRRRQASELGRLIERLPAKTSAQSSRRCGH
jgi:hypothetical protein